MSSHLRNRLEAGLNTLDVSLPDDTIECLVAYIQLFDKWNKTYNLSAVRDIDAMVSRHLLDSLAILPFVEGQRLIDVGTGGGLPGIPMAICHPEREIHLLDSNGKKTRFLFQVKTLLKLDNVQVHNCRVESFQPEDKFDGVMSRAFASLEDMTQGCHHLLKENGRFWAMKGIYPTDELKPLEKHYIVANSHALTIPGEEGERHVLEIRPR
ncbi:16S rRNA (guanine(527)-N(7))-methyltransferase RsmG [Pseudoteredinibacter isoporae]|uniref:Ribosomal RNA small subunit methyltransferase G n=1 Tax=Pseudoteredinibacter isoporae TaxID=570281 RepID=A0A7X0JR97_9GAMM|nr:16S rRNA (guanine(527)-N(7))-methyltransferase RsmG [Pseudoteredinibacter isoporae]MBB6520193.1 16S rRNA (guanine527-N7)-methyltransferase [Pseudoteredinibacter isoporae]NHO85765.1 16S rRNA (guanine(527)-N(7))-methyltransferase RsmG [Pseudoteredinibacter isoporae]NIB25783.1 16S rRNA (guanine(527)-N(7))-methyltransferase RsmG [Pseudoteredinibacter isoporae]